MHGTMKIALWDTRGRVEVVNIVCQIEGVLLLNDCGDF